MAIVVKMPKLGLEMEKGVVLEWFFDRGESVSEGDVIAEVESEKSIGEVEAREDGVLRRLYIEEGDSIPPGKPIGILAGADEDISTLEAEAQAELDGEAAAVEEESSAEPAAAEEQPSQPAAAEADSGRGQTATSTSSAGGTTEVKASPRAKQRAEELDVDLATVEGTGPMDSVTADDVEAAAEAASGAGTASDADAESVKASPRAKQRAEELDVDLATVEGTGPMDSVTADDVEAAAEAASTGADAGVERVADAATTTRFQRTTAVARPAAGNALLETTEAVRSAFEERVDIIDVVLVVTSAALDDQPVLNGTYAESTHQVREQQDIALVTGRGDTAESHVVRSVEGQSLTELVEAREAEDGGDGQASFSVATADDGEADGPLVNRPAVGALEVDASGQRAVPDGDGVDLQPLVTASLTYDTRAVGAAEADAFLERFLERAERASQLVLETYRGKE